MRKIWVVAAREYMAAVRTKAFIISILAMPVLMGGGIVAQALLKDQVDTTDKRIAVLDRSSVLTDLLTQAAEVRNAEQIRDPNTGEKKKPAYIIESIEFSEDDPSAQRLALSDRIRENDLHAFVEVTGDLIVEPEQARIAYHSQRTAMDDVHEWVAQVANAGLRELRIAATKLDPDTIKQVTAWVNVEGLGLVSVDEATGEVTQATRGNELGEVIIPLIIMMLMFMMIMIGATPLINSVLEEKMQRIAEVLLGSVTPFQLMMGKLIGTVGVSITVVAIYVIGAAFAADRTGIADQIPFDILPWFFAYQVIAILMFGALFIAIGSACNDLKEAQSLMMPVWILICIPMFVWIQVVKEPLSSFATGLSLFPPCTPMLMLIRQSTPVVIPAWQPWVGLAGVLVFTLLSVWVAGRIFRVGILMQGNPPRISELARWAIRG